MASSDVRDAIASKFLEALDAGTIPWRKPWTVKGGRPRNAITQRPYRGVNAMYLGLLQYVNGYATGEWLTLNQCKTAGGRVIDAEFRKWTDVVFWKFVTKEEDGKKKSFPLCRSFRVWNRAQCEGLPLPPEPTVVEVNPIAKAQEIIDGFQSGPEIKISAESDRACYIPSADAVMMPSIESFVNAESYYATMYHELGHATGHKSRLDRDGVMQSKGFGSDSYSREELIAEITSAFLCAEVGILEKVEQNSIAYVQGWAARLKSEPRLIIDAAGAAQRAADLILGVKFETPSEE